MADDIVKRLQCIYEEDGCDQCTFCLAKAEIERLHDIVDQLVDALKHARDPGPVAAYKSAAALAEWERIRNG